MAPSVVAAVLGLIALGHAELQNCGASQYDPAQYVCYDNQFLCPVASGEPLSYCAGACYSKFMYQCVNSVLSLLPAVEPSTPFTLTASNPSLPIDGKSVTACGQHWSVGGQTCSYCPSAVGAACPAGNITAVIASDGRAAMDTMVPGGQVVYLDPYWNVGYSQAHSAYIPPGRTLTGLAAYKGGGFVNLNGNGYGWVACPPAASGGGGDSWNLVAKNASNAGTLGNCYGINLKINELPQGTTGAWQYT
ncbi:Carbohydrate-binding module family 52 protein [Coniochaeta hoffmannii]|uniref:Carbohydrate-binding module family 52 protein n=1 Tax=Coniochaeta hoffmannii TaxID=91930 RepID=A0AA38R044_9PEZI|nr:Carbohydrate-binding module family 52 protein [Coniochaeta hoffmannii]